MAIIHNRVLPPGGMRPGGGTDADQPAAPDADQPGAQPCLSATWRLPDGTPVRGVFATARYRPG